MAKLVLIVLGLVLVYRMLKGYRRSVDRQESPPTAGNEDMVRCDHCGVHLPRSESIATRGRYFCTPEHQRLHNSR